MGLIKSKERTRSLWLLVVFVMAFSMWFTSSVNATLMPGQTGVTVKGYLGKGLDGKQYVSINTGEKQPKYLVKVGTKTYTGYCINPSKGWKSNVKMAAKDYEGSEAVSKYSNLKQENLSYALLYGFNEGKSCPYGNENDYYAATQTIVWQILNGNIEMSKDGEWIKESTSDEKYKLIKGHTYGINCYEYIKNQMSSHVKCADFASQLKDDKRHTMVYSSETMDWRITLFDGSGANPLKLADEQGLELIREGNRYTFIAKEMGVYNARLIADKSYGTSQSAMVFDSTKSSNQSVALGATDMREFYANFETAEVSKPKLKIQKRTDDGGSPEGFKFLFSKIADDSIGITEEDIINLSSPEYIGDSYEVGAWELDDKSDLERINKDMTSGKTGSYLIKIKGKIYPKAQGDILNSESEYTANMTTNSDNNLGNTKEESNSENSNKAGNKSDNSQINSSEKEDKPVAAEIRNIGNDKLENSKEKASGLERKQDEIWEDNVSANVTVTTRHVNTGEMQITKKSEDYIKSNDFTWDGAATVESEEYLTDQNGIINIDDISYGKYRIKEILTEEQEMRYILPKAQEISINEDDVEEAYVVSFENKARQTRVQVLKKSEDGQVEGLTFKLTGRSLTGEKLGGDNGISVTTDKNGIADFGYIPAGEYEMEEAGLDMTKYMEAEPQKFTIKGDEKEPIILTFVNKPKVFTIISKQDKSTYEELSGAQLQIVDPDNGSVIREWTSSEAPYVVEGLAKGKEYILKEVAAPEGYKIAEEIKFTADYETYVTMYDSKIIVTYDQDKNVKTGDDNGLLIIVFAGLLMSLFGILVALLTRKKNV